MSKRDAQPAELLVKRRQLARSMAEADADLPHDELVDLLANLYLNGVEGVSDKDVESEEAETQDEQPEAV